MEFKTAQDTSEKCMRYGIFGDVHGNIEAFKKVIEFYKKENIDEYLCVGDIVGYGADPSECIEEIKRLKAKTVCGNHDWAAAGTSPLYYFNPAAKSGIEWTRENLNLSDKEFLKKLKLVNEKKDFYVVHGSLHEPDCFPYIWDIEAAYKCFCNMNRNLCFVGHSHVAGFFFMQDKRVDYGQGCLVRVKPEVKYIINVGSTGQPRDGNPKAAFCIFDTDKSTIEIKRVSYDVETAKDKILKAGLPEVLAYRLLEGR